jgi:flavin-dependent dehydrogenase
MKSFCEPTREIPVLDEVDVLVVGAGPAGCGAALAAARQGMKTLLVEQFNFRVGTAAAVAVHDGVRPRDVDVSKVQERLRAAGVTLA